MRLDKYITVALQTTRSKARKVIKNQEIKVNEIIITKNDFVLKETDIVKKDGEILIYKEYIYLMMNKPQGYLSANYDNKIKTVFDLITDYDVSKLFLIGRLDIDTEGLIIITNDGKLCHDLTSPKKGCYKKYYTKVEGKFEEEDITRFKEGIVIYESSEKPYKCKEAFLEIINENEAYIIISEGKYHQIKKMCKALNKEVIYLKRVKIGELFLDESLKLGEYRLLTEDEIELLKN